MTCAKGVQTARCSFTNSEMQWLTWHNFNIVVVHFAFAANKKMQWLPWRNFDIVVVHSAFTTNILAKLIETDPAGTAADLAPRAGLQSHKVVVKGSEERGREVHV